MVSTRKLRIVALAVVAVVVFSVIFFRKDSYSLGSTAQPQKQSSTLIESANNANQDAAINKEISQGKGDKTGAEKLQKQGGVAGAAAGLPAQPITGEAFDPEKEFINTRALAPMTVFSKSYCPFSKRLKKLLHDNYSITPEPIIVELDLHEHGKEFQEYLAKRTERSTVPNVIVGISHRSKGGCDDFIKLHEEGKLEEMLNEWGNKQLSAKRIEVPLNV